MSYANIFELRKSLQDCIEYCREHPEREHSQFHQPVLEKAFEKLNKTSEKADREFTEWRMESREDQLAWKHLAKELRSVQKKLEAVNAIGFIDQKVMYRDREPLLAAVSEMIDYLQERTDVLDFAEDRADKLDRQRRKAISEDDESERALDEYLRYSKMRSDGLSQAKESIGNFRKTLRRELGKNNDEYQAIEWPHQVESDNRVL